MSISKKRMTQSEFIHEYNDKNREKFNKKLFDRDDMSILNAVSDIILSCERDKYFTLKVLSIRYITDYEEIYDALRDHEESRKKKGKAFDNPYNYIQMKDSDIMLLEVKYLIRKNGTERMKIDGKDQDVKNPEQILPVLIALPRFVNKYYFRLNGNYYSPTIQIVDGSTYNNSTASNSKCDSVTLKTLFMSVRIFRMFRDTVDINTKETIKSIFYTSIIFNNHVNVLYYILAKYGLYNTMQWFNINYIKITDTPTNWDDWYCFKKHNLYISVPKAMYGDVVVQSFVITIYDSISRDTTVADLFTYEYWLVNLGSSYKNGSVDKGLFVLDSLESIYDINTKKSIRLPEEEKKDIYHVLKWLIGDFPSLRAKDNVDVSIKKLRIAEYIAHVYAMKLSKGIHRVSDQGKKVKLKQVLSAVYSQPMYVISQIISMSNLISYVDMVNDNDATQVLKCTYKGISGLGEAGSAVQPIYRFVDPSHIGILDLDSSSSSDPGMTGMICPMTDIYGDSFSPYTEPCTWTESNEKTVNDYYKSQNIKQPFEFTKPEQLNFDYVKEEMVKRSLDLDKVICPLKDLNGQIDYATDKPLSNMEINRSVEKLGSLFTIVDDKKEEE